MLFYDFSRCFMIFFMLFYDFSCCFMIFVLRMGTIELTRQNDGTAVLSDDDVGQLVEQLHDSQTQMEGFRRLSQKQEILLQRQMKLIDEMHALLAAQKSMFDQQAVLISEQGQIIDSLKGNSVSTV